MANEESDISVESLENGQPVRQNIYGSLVSYFFCVSGRFYSLFVFYSYRGVA